MARITNDSEALDYFNVITNQAEAFVEIVVGKWAIWAEWNISYTGRDKHRAPQTGEVVSVCERLAFASCHLPAGPVADRA